MTAAEKRERASARNLRFEQACVTAFFVDVVGIADDLARSGHSYQGAISIAYRAIHVYKTAQDASQHAVGITLAECQRAFLEDNCDVTLDQLVDQLLRQIQTAQVRAEDRESFLMLTG